MDNQLTQHRLWAGAAAITALCAHYTTVLMATSSEKIPKAHWNEAEVNALVDYLYDHKSEAGDGGNFKSHTLNAAAAHIKQHLSQGPTKTAKMCKGKWTSLKATYQAIETYRNQSGFHWDNVCGANIQGDAAASVWNEATKSKMMQAMRPFRNTGWPYYDKMYAIMPTTVMKGTHVYRPTAMAAIAPTDPDPPGNGGCSSTPPSRSEIIAGNRTREGGTCGETMVDEQMTDGNVIGSSTLAGSNSMEINKNNSSSPLSSLNLGKRTHSIMSLESNDIDSSQARSTTATSFSHVKKKQMSLNAGRSDMEGLKTGRSNIGGSNVGGSNIEGSNAGPEGAGKSKGEKISQAAAVMGMQGSINRLTDAFEKSLSRADDLVADRQALAVDLVQKRQDELSITNIARMISLFTDRPETAATYLRLIPSVRVEWLRQELEKLDAAAL